MPKSAIIDGKQELLTRSGSNRIHKYFIMVWLSLLLPDVWGLTNKNITGATKSYHRKAIQNLKVFIFMYDDSSKIVLLSKLHLKKKFPTSNF